MWCVRASQLRSVVWSGDRYSYGFGPSMAALADVRSYAHENALILVVLANSSLSISLTPSTDILEEFVKRLLGE